MIDARQIVARHRNSEASVPSPSEEEWTLGAVVEHIVWLGSNSLPALPNAKWWSLLNSSGWPKADAKSVSCDGCVVAILPLSYDLVFLRNVEQDIRTRSTNSGFDTKMAKALSGAIAEIITNVWEHAQATTPALLAYECSGERLIASITDLGIGVLSSLRSNPGYAQLSSSLQALREAMRVGVSRHTVQGRGYPMLRRLPWNVTIVDSVPFMRTMHRRQLTANGWQVTLMPKKAPLDDLLHHNITAYADSCEKNRPRISIQKRPVRAALDASPQLSLQFGTQFESPNAA